MRVTHQLMKNSVLNNVNKNLGQMSRLQNMLSSGKALQKPSDDPIKVAQVMNYTTALATNDQYQKNIAAATSWMSVTEDSLKSITEVLQRVRELAIAGATDTMSEEARRANAIEVDTLTDVLVQIGNSSYQGRYIFSGHQTNTVPFTRDEDGISYHGDQGSISWEVAPSVTIRGNIDGNDLFMTSDMFQSMEQMKQGLLDNDGEAVNISIEKIDAALNHILDKTATVGAMTNGLDMTMENLLSEKINFTELRSKLEDIDFAETYMNYAMMENVYRASLSAGAKIIQPSLLDFLR
ncbi:MAG: flagellar hook-associated protein FlgL [Firmicutes bacterium]|nr:flagellar hook-associated protein FlgL [Bacillota bacterium]